MPYTKLSIVIPAYNEAHFIETILERVLAVDLAFNLEKEVVVVDDHSEDQTYQLVADFMARHPHVQFDLSHHPRNRGKGAAVHTGIQRASGDLIIVQDSDLEYDPREYNNLLKPIMEGAADVVYGSRFVGGYPHRVLYFFHSIGNKFLTFVSNAFTNLNLTDMETCFKLFRADILKKLELKEEKFGFEPEVTARMAKVPGIRVYEVGISYYGRTYREGKKITWVDGLRALFYIVKYNVFIR